MLLASSEQGVQQWIWLVFICERPSGNENLHYKDRDIVSFQKRKTVRATSKRNTLHQVEKFKYRGLVFASDGKRNKEIDTWIGKENIIICELHRSVFTKRKLSNTVKLSVWNRCLWRSSPVVMNLSNDWKSAISSASGREGFLRWPHGVTLRDKVRSCGIRKALNVEPLLLRIEREQLRWFRFVARMSQERSSMGVLLATPRGKLFRGCPRTSCSDYVSDLAWTCFGVTSAELSVTAINYIMYFES